MTDGSRQPKAFPLGDHAADEPEPSKAAAPDRNPRNPRQSTARRRPRAMPAPDIRITEETPEQQLVPTVQPSRAMSRRFRWGTILASTVVALAGMWAGLAATRLIEDLFARHEWLGWAGLAMLVLAIVAALAIVLREAIGLFRLRKLSDTQTDAARAISANDTHAAEKTLGELHDIYGSRADVRWALSRLAEHKDDVIDPADRVRLAERTLMAQLDADANRVIARTARRVSIITAFAPAALDIPLVGAQNLRMLRELATLYGGRPGTLGTIRLARMVAGHLAVTGGLAMSDSVISHVIGKGLIGRLSARFGEGVINGILTARIGLAALDLCRPLPFVALEKPGLREFVRQALDFSGQTSERPAADKEDR